jgi:hypothetical protein
MLCARKTQCGLYTPHRSIPTQNLMIWRGLNKLGRNRVTTIASRRLPHTACTVRVVDGPMAPSNISGGAASVASRRYSFGFVRWGQLVALRVQESAKCDNSLLNRELCREQSVAMRAMWMSVFYKSSRRSKGQFAMKTSFAFLRAHVSDRSRSPDVPRTLVCRSL